jgi:tetratricopeptide (TPR) repeat protein
MNLKSSNNKFLLLQEISTSTNTNLLNQQGLAFINEELYEESLSCFERSFYIDQKLQGFLIIKGVLLYKLNRLKESIKCYDEFLSNNPQSVDAFKSRGLSFAKLGNYSKALEDFNKALSINSHDADALNNQGLTFVELKRYEEALDCYNKVLSTDPNNIISLNNKGIALQKTDLSEEAYDCYAKILLIDPCNIDALNNVGITLVELKRYKEALVCYNKAFSLNPNCSENLYSKSYLLLLTGYLQEGFKLYENRWHVESFKAKIRYFEQPLWLGEEDLSGKTLLIYPEQGFGDCIQMFRYIKALENLNVKVILEANKDLCELFSDNVNNTSVIFLSYPFSDFDYHCPMMSLPLAFKTSLNSITSPDSYIKASPLLVNKWKKKLPKKTKPFIGLVWSGSSTYKKDHLRSIPFSELTFLFGEEFQFISLQKEVPANDLEELQSNKNIIHLGNQIKDFSDTAALIDLMDLVITIDSSTAHLSGAMGKPTWILTRYNPDWRWLTSCDNSPWYNSVTLFRQNSKNFWTDVLVKVQEKLLSNNSSLN